MPALTMFEVTPDHPVPISPQGGTATITVLSGDTLYYADTPQVSAANNQGSVTAGNVQTFTNPAWVRSASLSTVLVQVTAPTLPTASLPASVILATSPQVRMASSYLVPSGGDDSAAMANALTNFAPFAYPVIALGPGTFQWNSQVPALLRNTPAKIIGAGVDKTIIKLSAAAPRAFDFGKVADYDTFSQIEISDLTVDASNVGGHHHVVIGTYINNAQQTRISVNNLTLRRIKTINVVTDDTDTNYRLNVCVSPLVNSADNPCTLNDHVYEDLDFVGQGDVGVFVGFNASVTPSAGTYDRLTFRRVKHSRANVFGGATGQGSANLQVGAWAPGGTVVIDDCWGANSSDVGIEVDNAQHLKISDTVIQDAYTCEYLIRNFTAPLLGAQKQLAVLDQCEARIVNQVLAEGNSFQSTGFYLNVASGPSQYGKFVLRDCSHINTTAQIGFGAANTESLGLALHAEGPIADVALERFSVLAESLSLTPADNQQPRLIAINPTGACNLKVKGLKIRVAGSKSGGAGAVSLRAFAPSATVGGDVLTVHIEDYDLDMSVTGLTTAYGMLPGFKGGTLKGTIRRMRVLNDALGLTGVFIATAPTISPKLLISDCDFQAIAVANREFSIPAAQAPFVYLEKILWKNYPAPAVAASAANFATAAFTTATGNQYIGGYGATISLANGSGAGITAVDLSKDGTTYTNIWTQASGAMAQTVQFHVDNGDRVRLTFATTQPTVTVIPDK